MEDKFARKINYLRLSVTDRCNLRCRYCMPSEGVNLKKHEEILTLEELYFIAKCTSRIGIKKIRLTGGEPLVRKGIINLVSMIKEIPEIEDLSLTTNGTLLNKMALPLKKAGLDRVNISMDTLDEEKYKYITRGGNIKSVIEGIDKALELGLHPVKINCVLVNGFNSEELSKFILLADKKPLHIRFIELMPIGEGYKNQSGYIALNNVKNNLINTYGLKPVNNVKTNGPAEQFILPGGQGTIGFIGAISNHFCHRCNRLRVTADGKIKPCLDSDYELDLMAALRKQASEEDIKLLFIEAIANKPLRHNMSLWEERKKRLMSQIGG